MIFVCHLPARKFRIMTKSIWEVGLEPGRSGNGPQPGVREMAALPRGGANIPRREIPRSRLLAGMAARFSLHDFWSSDPGF